MRYYVESDGRIYLVQRDDALDLPFLGEISIQEFDELFLIHGSMWSQ